MVNQFQPFLFTLRCGASLWAWGHVNMSKCPVSFPQGADSSWDPSSEGRASVLRPWLGQSELPAPKCFAQGTLIIILGGYPVSLEKLQAHTPPWR